ncbi:MAG: hypothetical protein AB7S92_05915 [Parvibaculaceae bacterium]
MATGYFDGARLAALYKELQHECAQYAREHGALTAAQENEIAARLMKTARESPPAKAASSAIDPARPSS